MNNTLKNIIVIIVGALLIFVVFIAIQLSLNNLTNRATVISGVFSMIGGAVGAFGAYTVAVWQTNQTIKYDRVIRIKEKKVEKLEELNRAFVSCLITLEDVYKQVFKQRDMIDGLIEKKYTVFNKESFITPEIETEYIKGEMQLQSFKMVVMNNKEYLPVRIDSLEVFTSIHRMINVLDELKNIYKPMTGNNKMNPEKFNEYWVAVSKEFQDSKEAVRKYVSDPKKHIIEDIKENL